jgi:uncharacterized membrane protein YfcA
MSSRVDILVPMSISVSAYLLVALILLVSSVLQGAMGFASGLFGIPLLMLTGISLPEAVAISLVASAVQNCTAAWKLRQEIDFRLALRPMLLRFATLPLGTLALWLIGDENKGIANQLVGGVVLVILLVQWTFRVTPQPRIHPAWEWLAFSTAGFLLGICGMGGPPMVLWVMAHDWPMARGRALLFFLFASGLPLQALLLWLAFGNEILQAMLLGLAAMPVLIVGIYLGLALSKVIPDHVFRWLATGVLVLIAVSSIVMPWLR